MQRCPIATPRVCVHLSMRNHNRSLNSAKTAQQLPPPKTCNEDDDKNRYFLTVLTTLTVGYVPPISTLGMSGPPTSVSLLLSAASRGLRLSRPQNDGLMFLRPQNDGLMFRVNTRCLLASSESCLLFVVRRSCWSAQACRHTHSYLK